MVWTLLECGNYYVPVWAIGITWHNMGYSGLNFRFLCDGVMA